LFSNLQAQRPMENLGRGVVAVRTGTTSAFISWRLLGLDPVDIGFNVYRSTEGGTAVKLNSTVLTAGTNYTDGSVNFAQSNTYYVKPVISNNEQAASGSFTLASNATTEPCVVVPLRNPIAGYYTRYVLVGDLDGDSEYDYVLDRIAPFDSTNNDKGLGHQKIEAYKRDGTFLWEVDLGPTSTNTYNITPGAATIDMGHWDGWTVFDMDNDGKAEVLLKTANGVTFGDGQKLVDINNINQYISVLDGLTGAERSRIQIPTDYIARGQIGAQFGIGHLDGTTPSLVAVMKNRNADKSFNLMVCAWDFDGTSITQKWKWKPTVSCPDGHQFRVADVDGDGKDEICEIGFCLNGDGTLRYSLSPQGIIHGDRFYIGKFDPTRAGLQGYGVQQSNSSGLLEYYYDANTGNVLWGNSVAPASTYDVGRGIVGDIDPRHAGTEVWSFQGIYNGATHTKLADEPNRPYPCQTFWWDGDLLTEQLNNYKFEKWNYSTSTVGRLLTAYNYEEIVGDGTNPMFMGDILGDWRTEAIYLDWKYSKLVVFTTNIPSDSRIYTMAHNPQYRDQLTLRGYLESPIPDYYLGNGMATPPTPNISYIGTTKTSITTLFHSTGDINFKRLYVNSTGESLSVNFVSEQQSEVTAIVIDLLGKVVLQKNLGVIEAGNNTRTIDIGSIPKGINILKLKTNDSCNTVKFLR
jgi:rhamnogalacturonan endolyase